MKVTISNIAWEEKYDREMYLFLQNNAVTGIEIAPTRIFSTQPYEDLDAVSDYKTWLNLEFGIQVISLQSICYGRNEAIFSSNEERKSLQHYLEQAIDFAATLACGNLVFGSPKNRIIGENQMDLALRYFKKIGDYAHKKQTIMAFEPNPEIYGTNFINTTAEAIEFVKRCDSKGLQVNFDLGTFIYNKENLTTLEENLQLINHVHISEPYLEKINISGLHYELADMLRKNKFSNYVSIEMKQGLELPEIQDLFLQLQDAFNN